MNIGEDNRFIFPTEVSLCCGVIAQALYLAVKIRKTQPEIINALYSCFSPHTSSDDTHINKVCQGKEEVPTFISDAINYEHNNEYVNRFNTKVRPLLQENKIDDVIASLCQIVSSDDSIRKATVIDMIDDLKKSELYSVTHFNFSEFMIGLFIYAVQNTSNVGQEKSVDAFKVRFGNCEIVPWFTWGWTLLSGERGAVIAFNKKSEALTGLLSLLKTSNNIDIFCVFGGVATRLISQESCDLFSQWLSLNTNARLFLCYETGKAASGRAKTLDPNKIRKDALPRDPKKRMDAKAKAVSESIVKFADSVKDRVFLVPISTQLNHHLLLFGNDLYWNLLMDKQSTESTTFRALDSPTGIKTKKDQLEYMIRIVSTNSDEPSVILKRVLEEKIAAPLALHS